MTEETTKRTSRTVSLEPSREFEKILSQLQTSESVKEVKRIVKTSDSESTYDYDIQVDQLTGKQKVVERFTTSKKECAMCGGQFAQIFECDHCQARVCANDSRYHSWLGSAGGIRLCKNCFRQRYPDEFKRTESSSCSP